MIDTIENIRALAHKAYDAGQFVTAFEALGLALYAAVKAGSIPTIEKIRHDMRWMVAGMKA